MLQRLLLLWLVLSSGVAFFWPRLGVTPETFPPVLPLALRQWLSDPFVQEGDSLTYAVALTMFAIGAMLPRDEVQQIVRRWPSVLAGTALQYSVMPLLAFGMARLFGLEGNYLIGVVLVGCVPGAMASNVLTLNAGGNTSYSVSLTTSATLLSPVVVPLVLAALLATGKVEIDFDVVKNSSVKLFWTVVLPVVTGHTLTRLVPRLEAPARKWGVVVANLAILWIIAVVVAKNREPLHRFRFDVMWVLLAVNAGGYAAGYFGGWILRLPEPMRRALTLEIGMQNAGLGAMLALSLFPGAANSEIAVPPAMYTFGCMLTGTALAALWSVSFPRRATEDAS